MRPLGAQNCFGDASTAFLVLLCIFLWSIGPPSLVDPVFSLLLAKLFLFSVTFVAGALQTVPYISVSIEELDGTALSLSVLVRIIESGAGRKATNHKSRLGRTTLLY